MRNWFAKKSNQSPQLQQEHSDVIDNHSQHNTQMSGLKDRWRQGTILLKQKFGKAKATEDEEFKRIQTRTEGIEKATHNTKKHILQLVENFHAMSTTLQFIAEDFKEIYSSDDPYRSVAGDLLNVAGEIEKECILPFQEQTNKGCVDKLSAYEVQFPTLKDLVKVRSQKRLDYDYYKDRVEKLTAKPSKDPTVLPREKERLNKAKEEYDSVNDEIKGRMNELIDMRCEVNDDVLHNLIENLISYQNNVAKAISKLKESISTKKPSQSSMPLYPSTNSGSEPPKKSNRLSKQPTVKPPIPGADIVPKKFDVDWYYLDSNVQQQGPVSFKELRQMFKNKQVTGETYVFGGDMSDWKQIKTITELFNILFS